MRAQKKIALIGKSGVGKTTIAEYLSIKYDYSICNTGKRCRELAKEFFDNESKDILQNITDAFNSIEKGVWLKIALKSQLSTNQNIIIDSIRFIEDYNFVKSCDFQIWKISAPDDIRFSRLIERGQIFKPQNDRHQSEMELHNIPTDIAINNETSSLTILYEQIDNILKYV